MEQSGDRSEHAQREGISDYDFTLAEKINEYLELETSHRLHQTDQTA